MNRRRRRRRTPGPGWMPVWKASAEKAEREGVEWVVFKIPKRPPFYDIADSEMVEIIECILQKTYPKVK